MIYYILFWDFLNPSTAEHFFSSGRITTRADSWNFQGVGPDSYGNFFEVVIYDENTHIITVLFYRLVGTECDET